MLTLVLALNLALVLAQPLPRVANWTEVSETAAEKLGKRLVDFNGIHAIYIDGEVHNLNLLVHSPVTDRIDWVTVAVTLTDDQFSLEGVSGPAPGLTNRKDEKVVSCINETSSYEVVSKEIATRLDSVYIESNWGLDECLRTNDNTDIHFTQQQIKLQSLTTNQTNWYWAVTYAEHTESLITNLTIEVLQQFKWPEGLSPDDFRGTKDSDFANMTVAADYIAEKIGKELVGYGGFGVSNNHGASLYHVTLHVESPITNSTNWVTATASFINSNFSLDGLAGPAPSEVIFATQDCPQDWLHLENIRLVEEQLNSVFIEISHTSCNTTTGLYTSEIQIHLQSRASNIANWFWITSKVEHDDQVVTKFTIENIVLYRPPSEL